MKSSKENWVNTKDTETETLELLRLGNMLRQLMTKKGILSEAELARQVNLPQPTIHRLVNGHTTDPRVSTLELLAKYFEISLDQLLGHTPLATDKAVFTLPIISWGDAVRGDAYVKTLTAVNWDRWTAIDLKTTANCYGLTSKPSMEPRFSRGTLLIVDPNLKPQDGDLVIVQFNDAEEATLKEIIIDGSERILKQLTVDTFNPPMSNQYKILGVVIQSRYSYQR